MMSLLDAVSMILGNPLLMLELLIVASANLTYSGMIRLSDGSFSNEGRVLVYCNNEWRTVCDNGLSPTDASVICRQLGYTDYINYESRL